VKLAFTDVLAVMFTVQAGTRSLPALSASIEIARGHLSSGLRRTLFCRGK